VLTGNGDRSPVNSGRQLGWWKPGLRIITLKNYTRKLPPLAAELNYFLQAKNLRKICGLAEKLFYDKLLEKIQLEPALMNHSCFAHKFGLFELRFVSRV